MRRLYQDDVDQEDHTLLVTHLAQCMTRNRIMGWIIGVLVPVILGMGGQIIFDSNRITALEVALKFMRPQ